MCVCAHACVPMSVCMHTRVHTHEGTCQLDPGMYLIVLSVVNRPLLQERKRTFPHLMPAEQLVKCSQNPLSLSANTSSIRM